MAKYNIGGGTLKVCKLEKNATTGKYELPGTPTYVAISAVQNFSISIEEESKQVDDFSTGVAIKVAEVVIKRDTTFTYTAKDTSAEQMAIALNLNAEGDIGAGGEAYYEVQFTEVFAGGVIGKTFTAPKAILKVDGDISLMSDDFRELTFNCSALMGETVDKEYVARYA